MRKLINDKALVGCVAVLVVLLAVSAAFYLGDVYALKELSFRSVTPTQLAKAMRQDDFYSTYRKNVLIFSGTVSSASSQANHQNTISLDTHDPYTLTCDISGAGHDFRVGDNVKLEAVAYTAARQPNGVLLRNCIVL